MKKITLFLALALCLSLLLCACGEEAPASTQGQTQSTTAPAESQTTPSTEQETQPKSDLVTYTITVVDEKGTGIAGALVQMCSDTCFPGKADDAGVATFQMAPGEYKVSFLTLPAGYTYTTEAQEFYFEAGSTEMTIVLKAA